MSLQGTQQLEIEAALEDHVMLVVEAAWTQALVWATHRGSQGLFADRHRAWRVEDRWRTDVREYRRVEAAS